jgi:stage V sporulation protein AE
VNMDIFLDYLKVFAVGGLVCMLGQILINKTKMSSARILVTYMLIGVVLEVCGAFEPMKEFAGSGVTIPIMGFARILPKARSKECKKTDFSVRLRAV